MEAITTDEMILPQTMQGNPQRKAQMRTIFHGTQKPKGIFTQTARVKRVAAYCRVSTMLESQAGSLETQMAVFRQKITEREGWELVDVYADEGASGTSAKKRKEFQRMLADCEAGKIDYIITKSISRFARNTLECLSYIRHLQSLGVQILFEKENIDTGSNLSEMILTVLAAFAQEESRSISANLTWGIRKRFEAGEARWVDRYGYCKDAHGDMAIHPEQGKVVWRIFDMYEHGMSLTEVEDALNAQGIPAPRGGPWQRFAVSELLKSEVYMGDMILQKFRTVDHLTHKRVRNDATEVPSYYITDHHPAIVSRKTFQRVQTVCALRSNYEGHIPQYPYGETDIRCPLCGALLVQRNTRGNYKIRLALGCFTEKGCGRFAIRKHVLNDAVLRAYNEMDEGQLSQCTDAESFLRMKKERLAMDTVEYYWLDELVERIVLVEQETIPGSPAGCWEAEVHWRCGLKSGALMALGHRRNAPEAVAALYYANEAKHRTKPPRRKSGKSKAADEGKEIAKGARSCE